VRERGRDRERMEQRREREREERPLSKRHASIHDSKQTIRFRTDTLKYVAGKSGVLVNETGTRYCVVVYRSSNPGVL
jgi:hypothetical protein